MKAHFEMMAAYNAWANARLYDAAHALPDDEYRRDLGAAFKSLHGTLNHLVRGRRHLDVPLPRPPEPALEPRPHPA